MAYPDDGILQTWLDALHGVDVRVRKLFGCYCVYCDGVAVGWLSGEIFSLREVGLTGLPDHLRRPAPEDRIQEIPIPLDDCHASWLPKAVQSTADFLKAHPRPKRRR